MTILRTRTYWKRPERVAQKKPDRVNSLTSEQQAHVKAALRVLKIRHGSYAAVARLMRVNSAHLTTYASSAGRPGPGLAIRIADAAGVSTEDVLEGRFPAPGCCPYCGRSEK